MCDYPYLTTASDKIAIIALFIAIIVPGIQGFFGRRREWHETSQSLCNDLSKLFDDINSLVLSPNKVNHITFQYHLKQRLILYQLYCQRFPLKKSRFLRVENIIISQLMELPKDIEYERLLLLGDKDRRYHYARFCESIRNSILAASEIFIKWEVRLIQHLNESCSISLLYRSGRNQPTKFYIK